MGDAGVSSLNELNAKYKKWVKNSKTRESGSVGSCNATSLYTTPTVIDGTDPNRVKDYYLCGDKDNYNCKGLDWSQWNSIWGNCQMTHSGDRYDKCDNMAIQSTDGLEGINRFNMTMSSTVNTIYDPVSDTITGPGGCWSRFTTGTQPDCKIGNVNGQRPAYPNNKTVIKQVMSNESHLGFSVNSPLYTSGLEGCPTGFSRELSCALDGRDNAEGSQGPGGSIVVPGCGFGDDDGVSNIGKFCARDSSDYSDENVAQCCLGTLGNGPEVDTKGIPMSDSYKNCPREFCTSRIVEGTDSQVHCDNPETSKDAGGSQDETYCYEMSKECNQFFTDKCTTDVFSKRQGDGNPLKTYCTHWGHIQPDSFADKAEAVCDINNGSNDYTNPNTPPTAADLTHVNTVLNTPLCRSFITDPEHYATERPKLQHLCSHYMKPNSSTGVWEKQPLVDNEDNDVLENVCGCHYPDAYYTWWKTTQENRGVGTCQDSDGTTQGDLTTQETCEAVTGNTWNTDEGQASIVAAISDRMKPFPQCYYSPCTSSMLYNKEDSSNPCKMNLQLCYQQLTQNNMVFDSDGKIQEYPDMTGSAQQTCNQSQLLATPSPPADVGGDSDSGGFSLGSLLGGSGSGSGSGTGGDGGDSTMIIIIILVVIIIIIGVVAVVMLNKGDPNPPQQIAQQAA